MYYTELYHTVLNLCYTVLHCTKSYCTVLYCTKPTIRYLRVCSSLFPPGAVDVPKRPFAAIVGGSKVSSKISVIEAMLSKVDLFSALHKRTVQYRMFDN